MRPGAGRRAHGTRARYVVEHCRCERCTAANRVYVRERRRAEVSPFVMAGPACQHIIRLSRAGVGYKRLALLAGVGKTAVLAIRNGRALCRRETAEAILAVGTTRSADLVADGSLVDAAPVWSQIERLQRSGWTRTAIACQLNPGARALQLRRDKVTAATARAVASLYDEVFWKPESQARVPGSDSVMETIGELTGRRLPPWRSRGLCGDPRYPAAWWFPGRGDPVEPAKEVCRRCPVMAECREYGMGEYFGVWGGLSEQERRHIRAARGLEETARGLEEEETA